MELIYTDANRNDIGIMTDYTVDIAFGSDENDFELILPLDAHCCEPLNYIYYDDVDDDGSVKHTEYGGIIDEIEPNTNENTITYRGRTWHGILASKILRPSSGQDYLILSGEANLVLAAIISRIGLDGLFRAPSVSSGITINNYQFERYIDAYTGIKKMLAKAGAKLKMEYIDGYVYMSAVPVVDYSQDEEWDTTQLGLILTQNVRPLNHIICLGEGELKDRQVLDVYMDGDGNISTTVQTYTGVDEVVRVYDYGNAESDAELLEGATKLLQEAWEDANACDAKFEPIDDFYIGDIVGARDDFTGLMVTRQISKKILTADEDGIKVLCQIGD